MRLRLVVVFALLVGASVLCWVSSCVRLLEMCVLDVASLGCEFGWVVVGWALGGVSFVLVLVVSSLMMFSMWVLSALHLGCIGDIVEILCGPLIGYA